MSQPPYGSGWPPQPGGQPDWGGPPQQPQYPPQQPQYPPPQPQYPPQQPTQPLYPGQPQYPSPTQPLPPWEAPPSPPGQWSGPPAGPPQGPPPGPPYPPGPGGPGGPGGPPWGQPPRRNKLFVILAIIAVLAIGGGVTGLIVATSGKKKHDTHQSSSPTNRPTQGTGTPDFPTGSGASLPTGGTDFPSGGSGLPTDSNGTDFPTGSSTGAGTETADQAKIVANAQTVIHALADRQPSIFCPLVDPTDLKRLLKDQHIDKCTNIELKETYRNDYRRYTVRDPSAIKITGRIAVIPKSAAIPADFDEVELRRDTDGIWKFRFYS